MDILRVLVVGTPGNLDRITSSLSEAGHAVIPVNTFEDASEALSVQRFDAVLLGTGFGGDQLSPFVARIKELNRRPGSEARTAVLSVLPSRPLAVLNPSLDLV